MAMKKLSVLKNKKGVFYLLLSSLFVMIMIVLFLAYKEYNYTDRQKVVETRIMTINDFIKSMDVDSKRVIFIAGFRSLIALEDYVARSGSYLNNTEDLFRIAFYNGTVNGTQVDILTNSSYIYYLDSMRVKAADPIGINVDVNVTNITLFQETPWSVTVIVTAHVNIIDKKGAAHWEFDKDYSTNVSLINIRDPVYSVATYGLVPNTIRISNITDFVNDSNDTTNLSVHINNSFYISNVLAPSFIMRMKGDFSNSTCCGIESIVNIPRLVDQGVNYSTSKSIIDYILFTNVSDYTNVSCGFENMLAWFKMDSNHTATYEVNKLSYSPC